MIYYSDPMLPKRLNFRAEARIDSLSTIDLKEGSIILNFSGNLCWYKEYEFKPKGGCVLKVSRGIGQQK